MGVESRHLDVLSRGGLWLLLASALAGGQAFAQGMKPPPEAGFVNPAQLDGIHAAALKRLSAQGRAALAQRYPRAKIVASCPGSFTATGSEGTALTLLDGPVGKAAGGDPPNVLRVVLLGDGTLVQLPWANGPGWSYSGAGTFEDDGTLFYGEQKCVPGTQIQAFLKATSLGDDFIQKKAAARVDLRALDSICFSFDDSYNNWQCFAHGRKGQAFVRWGYQATAD